MKNIVLSLILIGALSACTPDPLATSLMLPSEAVYGQMDDNSYLKGKIMVGEVTYDADSKSMAPLYTEASMSLAQALMQAGYLAADETHAKYRLDASVKDIKFPSCMFGSCETGAAVQYTMTDIRNDKMVYDELLVVPHTGEYPLFGANMALVTRAMLGGALGENYAHLLQVLSRKSKSDFK